MPRRPRIKLADIPQHIVQRGVNREPCFFAEEDYYCYLHWLEEAAADWQCAIHAYVLMTNHVHILLTSKTADGPAKLMQSIGRRYVQYINRVYRRSGTLWEGRYKSSAVQTEAYLLLCQRYIELNPVRAGMVTDPAQYRWSSYGHNGLGKEEPRLTHHCVYESLGLDTESRLVAYRDLFRSELDQDAIIDIRSALQQGQPLGSEKFKEKICSAAGVRMTQVKRGRPEKLAEASGGEEQQGFGF
jgi:putative transposase